MQNRAKILIVALVAANLVLLFRINQQSKRVNSSEALLAEKLESIPYLATERRLLLSHVRDILRSDNQDLPVLSGVDAKSGDSVNFRSLDLDLVYVLSTQCAGCVLNLPLLTKLHDSGLRIAGISSQDSPGSLRAYAEEHQIPFPLVSRASGVLFKSFNRGIVPATIAMKNGEVTDLRVGNLARAFPQELKGTQP